MKVESKIHQNKKNRIKFTIFFKIMIELVKIKNLNAKFVKTNKKNWDKNYNFVNGKTIKILNSLKLGREF